MIGQVYVWRDFAEFEIQELQKQDKFWQLFKIHNALKWLWL